MTEGNRGWTAQGIADELARAIRAGEYGPGARLPGQTGMRERFGVADRTAFRALDLLRGLGLAYSVPGSGWFARSPGLVVRAASSRLSRAEREAGRGAFTTDGHAGGWTVSTDTAVEQRGLPEHMACHLDAEPGAPVVVRDRVMRANGEPVQVATSYLPADLVDDAPAIAEDHPGPGGIYARLDETRWRLGRFVEHVRAGTATEHEAARLRMAVGGPVLRIVRVAYSELDDRPVEANEITAAADRWELTYDVPAE